MAKFARSVWRNVGRGVSTVGGAKVARRETGGAGGGGEEPRQIYRRYASPVPTHQFNYLINIIPRRLLWACSDTVREAASKTPLHGHSTG